MFFRTGNIVSSTTTLNDDEQAALLASGPIRCAGIAPSGQHLATLADDKKLKIWEIADQLKQMSERYVPLLYCWACFHPNLNRDLPKKASSVQFTADSQAILVSDKFGDVFRSVHIGTH